MGLIADTLLVHLPAKKKHTPSGWISFNAPCCDDKRQRGGFIVNGGDAVSYHCFNCQFKASWQPGRTISAKMRKLMRWLNMSDDTISKLSLEALRLNENSNAEVQSIVPHFDYRALPLESEPINYWLDDVPEKIIPVLEYIAKRKMYLDYYDFYWTPRVGFSNRLIIPFYKDGVCVGYTARAVNDAKPKFISEQQPGYVFNLDKQHNDRAFVIVCEGPFDAISIDGCALLGSEIKDSQNWLLKQLGKEIVLVPDRDHEGPKTVEQAIEYGWSVSMPEWPEGVKDVNDAAVKLGRLATLYLIVTAKESNALKIRLRAKQWFKENDNEKDN
jgi:hypothetical protein